jgi:hypothetical protein
MPSQTSASASATSATTRASSDIPAHRANSDLAGIVLVISGLLQSCLYPRLAFEPNSGRANRLLLQAEQNAVCAALRIVDQGSRALWMLTMTVATRRPSAAAQTMLR